MTSPPHHKQIVDFMDNVAPKRERWIKHNRYYYRDLVKFLRFNIPEDSRVLEIGCGSGYLLNSVNPRRGVGIDISAGMIDIARKNYPHLVFIKMDAQSIELEETFDYIIISDTIGYFEDVQKQFCQLRKVTTPGTRVIITYLNFLWLPVLKIAELLRLKMQSKNINWLNVDDIRNLLSLAGFETVKTGRRFFFPKFVPLLSWLFNKYIAQLPILNRLCLTNYIVARQKNAPISQENDLKVSVVVPARNEKGNIEQVIKRMPRLGRETEIIFVEGGSTDDTGEEIARVCKQYSDRWELKWSVQEGKGKGDAVRKGFSMASGDILMILDADLTVPPEDLPKFYRAIVSGEGELVNGSRLVYPLEKRSMQTLNMMGNRFFSVMFSWILGQRLKDTLCGTKVITRENWQKLVKGRQYFGDFDPFGDFDLIFGAAKLNLKIVEIPIRYRARQYGETNISRFRHGWLLLKMMFFAMNKMKFL
jgi:ubiquinone/menaquinone biosynthesis C-methylase UbiE